jgi:cell division protein FtsA
MLAKDELAKIHRDGMLPGGVILTGAGVKMPGAIDLARDSLNLPVQIGFPQNFDGVVDKIDDPAYATAIGLLIWGSRLETRSYGFHFKGFGLKKAFGGIKDWARNLLP